MQIAHFGQCPEQLEVLFFSCKKISFVYKKRSSLTILFLQPDEPWSVREWAPSKHGQFTLRPRSGVEQGFSIDAQLVTVAARHVRRNGVPPLMYDGQTSDDGGGWAFLLLLLAFLRHTLTFSNRL